MKKLIAVVVAVAAFAGLSVVGSAGAAGTTTGTGEPSAADIAWIEEAIQIDNAEIAGGKTAQSKGTSSNVKALGKRLMSAHVASKAEHAAMAKAMGASVPAGPSTAEKAELAKVAVMKGSAFDSAYARSQVKGHQLAVKGAKKEIAGGSSTKVVAAAKKALKMYEMHLSWAQALLAEL